MPNHFDDLSRFLAELITADPGVAGPVRPSAPQEMLDSPDASFLRHVAVSRCDARIQYVLLKGDWRPIAWGALALPGATRQLERAAIYEFGQLPALDGGLGIFDTPAWRRSANALFVGIAPSDFADASTYSYVDPCLTFIRIVERRLRLGIPQTRRAPGLSLPLVITAGNTCPSCARGLAPMAVTCLNCGWTLPPGGNRSRTVEPAFPDGLPDT